MKLVRRVNKCVEEYVVLVKCKCTGWTAGSAHAPWCTMKIQPAQRRLSAAVLPIELPTPWSPT